MSDFNYYDILEVPKDASDIDIQRAYRKLSLKWHPDRNPDRKEEAEEMFKKINEAKNILLDPDQRSVYDRFGREGLKNGGGPNINFNGFENIFSNIFGAGGPFGNAFNNFNSHFTNNFQQERNHKQQKIIVVNLNLEHIYNGYKHNKKIKIENDCSKCEATGKSTFETCKTCQGRGQRMMVQQVGPGIITQSLINCNICDGKGKCGSGDICSECSGSKKTEKIISIEVIFPAGVENNTIFRKEVENIEFIFQAQVEEHQTFKREGNNIKIDKDISLLESITGVEFNITLPNNKEILIKSKEDFIIKPNTTYKIKNVGINNGDLLINFHIIFPVKIHKGVNLKEILNMENINKITNDKADLVYITE